MAASPPSADKRRDALGTGKCYFYSLFGVRVMKWEGRDGILKEGYMLNVDRQIAYD